MKMEAMNISLTPEMAEYARSQAGKLYGNVSEFFRELLRQRIQSEIEADVKALEEAAADAKPEGLNVEKLNLIIATQKAVRKARQAA